MEIHKKTRYVNGINYPKKDEAKRIQRGEKREGEEENPPPPLQEYDTEANDAINFKLGAYTLIS
jgi:hypothetical protein